MPEACVFCDILAGGGEASFVYRDPLCAAFLDIAPINEGHVLVVPNKHAGHLADLDPSTSGHLLSVGHRIASAIRASDIRSDGVFFFLADGEVAGQEVPHVHLHVVPRFERDGFRIPECGEPAVREALDATATKIAVALGRPGRPR